MRRHRGTRRVKIIEWEFWRPKHVKVPVYLKLRGETLPEGYVAIVRSAELTGEKDHLGRNAEIKSFEGEELNVMQQEVESYLQGFSDIKWKDYLEVVTDGGKPWRVGEEMPASSLIFRVTPVQIGKDSEGNIFHRSNPAMSPQVGRPKEGYDKETETMTTIIPHTPETRRTLQCFADEMDKMGVKIQEFLSPKKIQQTLGRAVLLLTGGKK